jgi:NodT family efflux transporter outer membrane factor (OMF) lipoprotein
MNRLSALPVLVATSLAACSGPHVETATVLPVVANAAWRTDAGPTMPLDRNWWRAFHDPVLAELIDRALANNLDIAIAVARVREARAQERAARAALYPTLDAGLGAERSRSVSPFGTPEVQTAAEPLAQAAYEVDLFGRIADQASAARSSYLASQAARDSVRLAVASAVASGYVTLLAFDARLEIAHETLTARTDSLRIIRSRVTNGYSPSLDLAQAEADYQATAQNIPQIELGIARQEDALRQLVGETPGPVQRGTTLTALTAPAIPEGLPSDLLRRRPDLAQAEHQLAAADSSLAAARKRFLPQLRLSASAGAAFSTLLADPITLWSVGGSILAPLFEGGRLTAQAEGAAALRDQAAFAYRRAALGAFREVDDALATVRRQDEQVQIVAAERDALAEGLRLATNRYRSGYSPFLEQLDAQRGLLSARLALVQVQSDALNARIQLYQAMGGGWNLADVGEAPAN